MKIGLFSDTYYPQINGVATSVRMLRDNLLLAGHEVYVFTTTNPNAPDDEKNIIRIPSVAFRTERLGTYIRPRLYNEIKKLSLDIIHTHTEYTLGYLGRIMSKRLSIPQIHTMHTMYEYYTEYIARSKRLESPIQAFARKLTVSFCNNADAVVVPTGKIEDLIVSYGVNKKISIIPTGIALDKFAEHKNDLATVKEIRSRLGILEDSYVLLYVGRIAHEKNINELLTSLQNYLLGKPQVFFVIVGKGPALTELKALAEELGISSKVIFAGACLWDEINYYYRLGDIFVGASQSETQGLTYIEAMASGLPVVAKEDRCLENLLVENENGYFFNSSDDMVKAVDKLLTDKQLRTLFSRNATISANKYSSDAYAEHMAILYTQVLKKQLIYDYNQIG